MSKDAVEVLRSIQGWQLERKTIMEDIWVNSGYVVTNPFGKPLDPNLLTRDFRSIVTKNQLPHLTFHGLRHLAAALLLKEGKSPKIVSELLGHSTITVTMDVYSHVLPNMQREAVQSLDQYL